MFLIRQAGPKDFSGVYALAKRLDSYNLPADPAYIRKLLATSQASFQGQRKRADAQYLFVLEEVKSAPRAGRGQIAGCSLIIAKHGIPGHPHLWFALEQLTKRSRSLKRSRSHRVLRMGYTENGPTEVGGLIVHPQYREIPEHCGLQLAYVRFLYMAMHPGRFERDVLIEYRGAMGAGNTSPFWEAMGRVFTGLSYSKADRLSVTNKEFIWSLLPQEPIYYALLPKEVQRAIGALHPSAARAARLCKRIGFREIPQVEPFDGGPYYSAPLRQIRLVRQTQRLRLCEPLLSGRGTLSFLSARVGRGRGLSLIGTDSGGSFRAILAKGAISKGRWTMGEDGFQRLGVEPGKAVYVCSI